jgi:hypothetical protein
MTKGGVSFTVDFNTGDPSRMPSRLADALDEAVTLIQNEEEVDIRVLQIEIYIKTT